MSLRLPTSCPKPTKKQKPFKFSSLDGIRKTPIKKSGRPKPVNAKRRQSEFARCYGSRARVAWVKSLPCVVLHSTGEIENVHVRGGGAGRKADACWIVPMKAHLHRTLHEIGLSAFEGRYGILLDASAAHTELQWQARCARKAA